MHASCHLVFPFSGKKKLVLNRKIPSLEGFILEIYEAQSSRIFLSKIHLSDLAVLFAM
jgi:hypothetical protein